MNKQTVVDDFKVCAVDPDGRYVLLMCSSFLDRPLYLLAIYAPAVPTERATFVLKMKQMCEKEVGHNPLIVVGDFNITLHPARDRLNGNQKDRPGVHELRAWMEETGLVDEWRVQHPDAVEMTWRSRNNTGLTRPGCRLDYFLI